MPNWLNYALWTIWVLFSLYEVLKYAIITTDKDSKLNTKGWNETLRYLLVTIFWLCYTIFG